jgi:hypothetical protein
VYIQEADLSDVLYVATNLRPADRAELRAATTARPTEVMKKTFGQARKCYVARVEEFGNPVILFGVMDKGLMPGAWFDKEEPLLTGSIWLVGTDEMEEHSLTIAKEAPKWIEYLGQGYDVLANCVWQGNHLHIKWLDFAGFSFKPCVQYGPDGDIFLPFYKMTSQCVTPSR